jgi:hypothetical protein
MKSPLPLSSISSLGYVSAKVAGRAEAEKSSGARWGRDAWKVWRVGKDGDEMNRASDWYA